MIKAHRVVLATGVDTPRLAKPFGVRLPIRPAKGYSLTLDMTGANQRPTIAVTDDARHIAATPLGDRLRVVGMAEFVGRDRTPDPRRIDMLFRLVERLYPASPPEWTGAPPPPGPAFAR